MERMEDERKKMALLLGQQEERKILGQQEENRRGRMKTLVDPFFPYL